MSQKDWDNVLRYKESIINSEAIADIWHVNDVIEIASNQYADSIFYGDDHSPNIDLAKKVLARMADSYNAEYGITDETVDNDISHVLAQFEQDAVAKQRGELK
jgi:hypothetical protein